MNDQAELNRAEVDLTDVAGEIEAAIVILRRLRCDPDTDRTDAIEALEAALDQTDYMAYAIADGRVTVTARSGR